MRRRYNNILETVGDTPVVRINKLAPGSTILCMLPDTGERYLSTPLFADIPSEMTAEEQEISRSWSVRKLFERYNIP